MNLLGHITMHDVAFVVAVFLFGIALGFTLGWSRNEETVRERERR